MRKTFVTQPLLVASLVFLCEHVCAHTDVTAQEAKNLIDTTSQLTIVDVREESEFCEEDDADGDGVVGHIPGAVNYPWISEMLQPRYAELPVDGDILVVCRSGHRSDEAAEFLDSKGFTSVYDMQGGMRSWQWDTEACLEGCPAEILLSSQQDVESLRIFRNEVLLRDDFGFMMTVLYYYHASEVASLLSRDPDIANHAREALDGILAVVQTRLAGERAAVHRDTVANIESLLDGMGGKASPKLRGTLKALRDSLGKRRVLEQLGIRLVE